MRDRGFLTTVGVGVVAAVVTAVACGKAWATAGGRSAGAVVHAATTGSSSVPLALALSLVVLAGWGALLVTRGRVRTVVAAVALVAAVGVLATTIAGAARARADAVTAAVGKGAGAGATAHLTGWYWIAVAGSLVTALTLLVAVRRARDWPAMGSRYDAPAPRATPGEEATDEDLWRAIDRGNDPTA